MPFTSKPLLTEKLYYDWWSLDFTGYIWAAYKRMGGDRKHFAVLHTISYGNWYSMMLFLLREQFWDWLEA